MDAAGAAMEESAAPVAEAMDETPVAPEAASGPVTEATEAADSGATDSGSAVAAVDGLFDGDDDDDAIGDISDDDADVVGEISDDDDTGATAAAPKDVSKELAKVRQDPKNRTTEGVFESDDEDGPAPTGHDASESFFEEEEVQDIEYAKELPMTNRHFGDDVTLLKMPNFLSIEPLPFHPETYEEVQEDEVTGKLDELGRNRVKLSVDNTLRWRYAADEQGNYIVGEDGEYAKESNAKLVKWSDGSETLVLGEAHIGVVRKDISSEVNCLLLQHDEQNLEFMGLMNSKISLKPTSTKSKFHQRLTKTSAIAVEKKLQKIVTIKGSTADPKTQKQEMDRSQSAHINASRRREEKQYAERERHTRGAPMSRDFLEEGIEEDDDGGYMKLMKGQAYSEDEAEESEDEVRPTRAVIDDDDEAGEAEKADAAEGRKRRKIDDSDEDD